MNLRSGCALRRERARDGSSLLCRPVPLVGTFATLTGKRRDDLPPVRQPLPGGSPQGKGEVVTPPGAATRKLPLFPFAGLNLIRFHGSRINGLSFASFDGQHSDKMAPV